MERLETIKEIVSNCAEELQSTVQSILKEANYKLQTQYDKNLMIRLDVYPIEHIFEDGRTEVDYNFITNVGYCGDS